MAGTGVKGVTEALRALGLSSQGCRTVPVRSRSRELHLLCSPS